MIYVFDTSSIRSLQHFYPRVFRSIWDGLEVLVSEGQLISTREVLNELERQAVSDDVLKWAKDHRVIFRTPNTEELRFVATIFQVRHFQALIGQQQRLKGTPVADPFVIACAKVDDGTLVTDEGWVRPNTSLTPKPNAAKIPNVCAHFGIPCIDLEEFMHLQGWNLMSSHSPAPVTAMLYTGCPKDSDIFVRWPLCTINGIKGLSFTRDAVLIVVSREDLIVSQ